MTGNTSRSTRTTYSRRALLALAFGGLLAAGLWFGFRPESAARQPQVPSGPLRASASGEVGAGGDRAGSTEGNRKRELTELPPPRLQFAAQDVANTPISIPWLSRFDASIQFDEELDMSSLEGRMTVVPEKAIAGLQWVPSQSVTEMRPMGEPTVTRFTAVQFWLVRPISSDPIVITFSPGIRGRSGRILAQEARFELVVTGKGPPVMVLEGRGYEAAGEALGTVRATSESSEREPVFVAGPATLHIDFRIPVDTEKVGAAVARHFTERGFTVDPPQWDAEGRALTLPIQDMPRKTHHYFSTRDLAEVPGPPSESSTVSWMVTHPLQVYRSQGELAESVPVGTLSTAALSAMAGPRALHGGRLLSFQYVETAGDFLVYDLVLWELGTGKETRLMEGVGLYLEGGWLPGGKELLVNGSGQALLQFAPERRDFRSGEMERRKFFGGDVVGMAISPTGKVAVFHVLLPAGGVGDPTGIELVVLGSGGEVLHRVGRVSEISKENELRWIESINADWSDDGTSLVFTHFARGKEGEPMQSRLSLWRQGMSRPKDLGIPARGVSWRRGTNQVLVADEERQGLLYDVRSRQVVREGLPWGRLWSPDGRFLAWNYASSNEDSPQAGVYELETGRQQHIRGHAFGWDPADGQLYWAGELAGE